MAPDETLAAVRRSAEGFAANRIVRATRTSRRAGVAVVLYSTSNGTFLTLIRRASRGMNPGQWALPGGKVESGENAAMAALREAEEEVGLPRTGARILAQLDDFNTATGFGISPYVIEAEAGWEPYAASDEVQYVLPVPLSRFIDDDIVHWAEDPKGRPLLQMRLSDDAHVHAPTGAILFQFREVCLFRRDCDVTEFVQPHFTHR